MDGAAMAGASALWLGILTSISPCRLATNIAAVSFVGRQAGRPRAALATAGLYTAGRMLAYLAVGAVAVWGLMSMMAVSGFLQNTLPKLLGPILIAVGLLLLGVLRFELPGLGVGNRLRGLAEHGGVWGALVLGFVFALSFCPVSAGLFFGSLVPLAAEQQSPLVLPAVYGLGTALPVLGFALLFAAGGTWMNRALDRVQAFERAARKVTGVVFILVGLYETLRNFGLLG